MAMRSVRLYPLYIFALIPASYELASNMRQTTGHIEVARLAPALGLALLMLPAWGYPAVLGVRWSLTFELISNFIYGLIAPLLRWPVLILLVVVSGATLVFAVAAAGTADIGYRPNEFTAGLARVIFSFFSGVALYRFTAKSPRLGFFVPLTCCALTALILTFSPPKAFEVPFELLSILILFPLIVLAAARHDLPPTFTPAFTFLGVTSYAIYVLHQPGAIIFESALKRIGHLFVPDTAPWSGIVYLVLLVIFCWVIHLCYDGPVRALLKKWLNLRL